MSIRGKQLGKNGRDFPENVGVFINAPGLIGMYSGLQNLKFLADIQGKISETEIREAMGKVGLDPENKTKVSNYSLGMKQKLGLAQAIMEDPQLFILDEPFNGLDKKGIAQMHELIMGLKKRHKTILLASHNQNDIDALCDVVCEMDSGVMHCSKEYGQ